MCYSKVMVDGRPGGHERFHERWKDGSRGASFSLPQHEGRVRSKTAILAVFAAYLKVFYLTVIGWVFYTVRSHAYI